MTVIWKPLMPTYITRVFCYTNFNSYTTHLSYGLVMPRRDLQLFHTNYLTYYHFYFEVLISLRPEVNNLCVYITLLLQSCSYNIKYELHNNHEPTATYWIHKILFRYMNRSINRLKLKPEKATALILELERKSAAVGEERSMVRTAIHLPII